jgi:N-acyl-D-amino-acid deacylase
MIPSELRIANASVLDGTGAPETIADVVVRGDRIEAVDPPSADPAPDGAVDGTGLVLAPGFVDVHTHDDWTLLLAPEHHCKTRQGVTSVVIGNCGSSVFPATENLLGMPGFDRLADYFDALDECSPAVNVAALAGHGSMRTSVMGLRTDRAADAGEMAELGRLTEQAMADGAVGMSSGLAYEPGRYSAPDELVALNRIVAAAGGIYATHMRDEADGLLASVDESIAVAESSGVALQISHLKAAGSANWGMVADALERVDAARARGLDVMADQYPYTRGSSLLEQVVNGGALDGSSAFGTLTTDQVHVAAAPTNPHWEGRTITEIAAAEHVAPRAMADRIIESEGRRCVVVIDIMSEDDVRRVMAHPAVMFGTDGLPVGDKPHPRLAHTYPRVLGRYVREQRLLGLPEAIHRMTQMPARRFGFEDRGEIRVGAFADLVLFDPATVADTGTYADPGTVPDGIHGVWVNGRRVVDHGEATDERPGRVIRRGDG